ncbi:MAG: S9 family peptidase [Bacteroidia bacterium]|nr:S9 family peptidase [Bacteroidia bacterium]
MTIFNLKSLILLGLFGIILNSCKTENQTKKNTADTMSQLYTKSEIPQPIAKKVAKELTIHEDTRMDNYYWLNDREDQEVLDYLNSENAYKDEMLSHTEKAQEKLFDEIISRIKQDDNTVPYKDNGYMYQTIYEEGNEYPIHVRYKGDVKAKKEVMLDVNELAKDYDYYSVGGRSVSPDNQWLIYGEDTLSRRIYTLRFKNLSTGATTDTKIEGTTGSAVWASDNKTIFYTKKDVETLRAFQIYRHKLGSDPASDQLIYEEKDNTFYSYIYKSKSKKYLIIGSSQTISDEYRILEADNPDGAFRIFQNREPKLEYGIAHFEDKFFIRTNKDGAQNFKIMETPEGKTGKENWKDFIEHRTDVLVEGFDIFKDFIVVSEREKGITQIDVRPWQGNAHRIQFQDEAFLAYTTTNIEFDTDILRLGYTSLTTPRTIYDYDMNSKEFTLLKQQEVVGGEFDPNNYVSERVFAKARDGVEVPISIVYRKGFKKDGSQPLLLYAYGSYGSSMNPTFSSVRLSLLDRGFAYAIAHIRGGQEMGRHWYEDGKLLNKKNTFYDFIDCGEYLVKNKYAHPDQLHAMGGSAGGLLMGAVVNYRPDLWKGVVAAVPFVDVVTTMLDESIPLTTFEFDEWGNPKKKEYYDYMKSYSPYDNVEAVEFPALLITTGLHDSQVQYFEPAKWVAKMREMKVGDNPLIFSCNMDAGHGGQSGRFRRYKETAMEYAFLLDLAGKLEGELMN